MSACVPCIIHAAKVCFERRVRIIYKLRPSATTTFQAADAYGAYDVHEMRMRYFERSHGIFTVNMVVLGGT